MKKSIVFISIALVLLSCKSTPENFTYSSNGKDTGLDRRINIQGIYITDHACDTAFFSIFRFSSDGKFSIATSGSVTDELIDCFEKENSSKHCEYLLNGFYILQGDTIKTQVVWPIGNGCVIFRDYIIQPDKSIINTSDYVEPHYTNLAYMKNYPSFYHNPCSKKAKFYPFNRRQQQEIK
ncbi:MAG: hypothetical protein LIO93_03010 [Bacteroidales bacterium]|nr:hypothetical protein [Bacteroidales bacterium]